MRRGSSMLSNDPMEQLRTTCCARYAVTGDGICLDQGREHR